MGGRFPAGDFAFPFAFRLPGINLPSSYHDSKSYIRYWLDASIERPMWFNEKAVTAIFVVEPVDVSRPELQMPQGKQKEQGVCCCCLPGGKVNIHGKINKKGYYAGEVIEAKLHVENQSNRKVTYTEVVLKENIVQQYSKDGHTKMKTNTVAAVKDAGVAVGQEADINSLRLVIPQNLLPSTSMTESIVHISYHIEIKAHVKGACVCAAEIIIPITIGFASSGHTAVLDPALLEAMVQALCQEYANNREEIGSEALDDNEQRVQDTAQLIPQRV